MPRKGPAPRRKLAADPVYHSVLVTQLINKVMLGGKKTTAEAIVYGALERCAEKSGTDGLSVLKKAVENSRPHIEVKSRRVGGATYQVPIEVPPRRSNTLAIRWIVGYSRGRRGKSMGDKLAGELLDAANGVGAAVKRRDDTHKMADANKAFAHYRW